MFVCITDNTINFWPYNVVNGSICYQNVRLSVGLSATLVCHAPSLICRNTSCIVRLGNVSSSLPPNVTVLNCMGTDGSPCHSAAKIGPTIRHILETVQGTRQVTIIYTEKVAYGGFHWYRKCWAWTNLNGVMAVILPYLTEIGSFGCRVHIRYRV